MSNVLHSQNDTAVTHLSSAMTATAKSIAEFIVITPQFIIDGWSSFIHLKAYQVEDIYIAKEIYLLKR